MFRLICLKLNYLQQKFYALYTKYNIILPLSQIKYINFYSLCEFLKVLIYKKEPYRLWAYPKELKQPWLSEFSAIAAHDSWTTNSIWVYVMHRYK